MGFVQMKTLDEYTYNVRCDLCGDYYPRSLNDDEELICSLCREEQKRMDEARENQDERKGYDMTTKTNPRTKG